MSTSTTKQDTVTATAPYAMHAVARHMLDHGLPAPMSINRPFLTQQHIPVSVGSDPRAYAEWRDSIDIESETVEPSSIAGHERVMCTGRLQADLGEVRVILHATLFVGRADRSLSLVPGGAA